MDDTLALLEEILLPKESRVSLCEKLSRVGIKISPKTLANLDSQKKGIKNPKRIRGKVYYSKEAILEWIIPQGRKVKTEVQS